MVLNSTSLISAFLQINTYYVTNNVYSLEQGNGAVRPRIALICHVLGTKPNHYTVFHGYISYWLWLYTHSWWYTHTNDASFMNWISNHWLQGFQKIVQSNLVYLMEEKNSMIAY